MSETRWTKGPWVFGKRRKYRQKISAPDSSWYEFASVVVRLEGDAADNPKGVANAHLIAAAPELYEALDLMLEDTDGWDEEQLRKRHINRKVDAILLARAARTKARGEAA